MNMNMNMNTNMNTNTNININININIYQSCVSLHSYKSEWKIQQVWGCPHPTFGYKRILHFLVLNSC